VEVQFHLLLTLALDGGEWSASGSGRFTPGIKSPGIKLDRELGDLRPGLDVVAKRKNPITACSGN